MNTALIILGVVLYLFVGVMIAKYAYKKYHFIRDDAEIVIGVVIWPLMTLAMLTMWIIEFIKE